MPSSTVLDASQIAILIAGVVWPIILQGIRSVPGLRLDGRWAHAVAILFCYILAAAVEALVNSQPLTGQLILVRGSEIAGIAQLVYGQVVKPYWPTTPLPPSTSR